VGGKPGGQIGRRGTTLLQVDDPDEVEVLKIDRTTLPKVQYRDVGYEARQVIDLRWRICMSLLVGDLPHRGQIDADLFIPINSQ
jgi:hypothetical protein